MGFLTLKHRPQSDTQAIVDFDMRDADLRR
jgi:hypothetical protein